MAYTCIQQEIPELLTSLCDTQGIGTTFAGFAEKYCWRPRGINKSSPYIVHSLEACLWTIMRNENFFGNRFTGCQPRRRHGYHSPLLPADLPGLLYGIEQISNRNGPGYWQERRDTGTCRKIPEIIAPLVPHFLFIAVSFSNPILID